MSSLPPSSNSALGFFPGVQAPQKPLIFVSYALVDDEVLPAARAWWVRALMDNIKALVPQAARRPDDFAISLDRHALTPNDPLTAQIVDAVRQSDVLMVARSIGYTRSGWCGKERNESLQAVRECGAFEIVPAPKGASGYGLRADRRHGKGCAVYGIA